MTFTTILNGGLSNLVNYYVVFLVSTYVVCERLSVMHEPAGVVEILVQILQNTPYSEIQFQNTPPPPENENSQRVQVREFQNTPPPNWNLGRSWHFKTFQFQNTPPLKIEI